MKDKSAADAGHPVQWWHYGHVWMVFAGPAVVVVAALVTAWIAMGHPDPVLSEDYYQKGLDINKTLQADKALLPALTGRNHAATPAAAVPR